MLNKCILIGRLTKDPEMSIVGDAKTVRFTLAVDKRFKGKSEDAPTADFIPVRAWRKTAEFVEKFFFKGKQVYVVGSLETYSYEKDGTRRNGFNINADEVGFADTVKSSDNNRNDDGFPAENPSDFGGLDGFDVIGGFEDNLPL